MFHCPALRAAGWKGAGTLCADKAAPFPSSRCLPERPTGLHNYRVERGAERLQPLPLLRVSYCALLLMRFLFYFFCQLCHTAQARRSEIVLYSYAQLIRDKKANQFFLNLISLVLSCSFLTVIGLPCWKRFSGELPRKRLRVVCPGSAVWPPRTRGLLPRCVTAPAAGGQRFCPASWVGINRFISEAEQQKSNRLVGAFPAESSLCSSLSVSWMLCFEQPRLGCIVQGLDCLGHLERL